MLVRCSKWNHVLCPKCEHRIPHSEKDFCMELSQCFTGEEFLPFLVRCEPVEKKDAK